MLKDRNVKCATYRNDTEDPIGVRLDSIDVRLQNTGGRGQSEWIWVMPNEQAKIPTADVRPGRRGHNLTLVE